MNSRTDYTEIEHEITNISRIIDRQQKSVNELSMQRNHLPVRYTYDINNDYDFEEFLKEKQIKLIKIIKQKIELENKLQKIHEERYKELENSNALSGVSDVMKLAFQYAHPIDIRTKKYAVEKREAPKLHNARSHSPGRHREEYDRIDKRDRFELFLDFLTDNLKILKFICVIAFIVIQFLYILAFLASIVF
jgi:hypothetical protein